MNAVTLKTPLLYTQENTVTKNMNFIIIHLFIAQLLIKYKKIIQIPIENILINSNMNLDSVAHV